MEELNYHGFYIGRDYEKGKSANGKDWEKYTLRFKPREGNQFGFSIPVFMPIYDTRSLTVDKLNEGNFYKLTYILGNKINQKSGKPFKNFIRIEDSTPEQAFAEKHTAIEQQQSAAQPHQLDLSHFNEFKKDYFAGCEKKGIKPNAMNMIGNYLNLYDSQYVEKLVMMARAAIAARETVK